jgi:hypothetical protein
VGLRDSIRQEPGPALALLSDPRPEVQTTALGALEHRPHWRPGEAELVLKFGRESREPAVRAAAVYALAGVDTADLVAGVAEFLRDPATEVRLAAAEAVMWKADIRWPFTRELVKEAMADQKLAGDGALFIGTGRLPAAAVADLITWSAEHAPLAQRAILTLIEHYHNDLLTDEHPELGSELAAMMLSQETPPPLRVELASLLRDHHMLSPDLLDRLTNPNQPGPIRLFAAELMLRINPHDPDGVDVLRGLARQPNRELAVRVAAVLQNVLGLDLGLSPGELPQPNSKPAADVAEGSLPGRTGRTRMSSARLPPVHERELNLEAGRRQKGSVPATRPPPSRQRRHRGDPTRLTNRSCFLAMTMRCCPTSRDSSHPMSYPHASLHRVTAPVRCSDDSSAFSSRERGRLGRRNRFRVRDGRAPGALSISRELMRKRTEVENDNFRQLSHEMRSCLTRKRRAKPLRCMRRDSEICKRIVSHQVLSGSMPSSRRRAASASARLRS